jgi:hypothetical protein
MSISQRQSIITLLPKPEKDTKILKNWRPISLLNIDFKLMTKCLAFRLKKVLPNIIHSDETGFMRGRYIGDNIRNILEIIETVEEDLSCIILSVDFEKAFDSLSWKFLQQRLDYFKFGPSFKKWTYILFQNISSCVLNTG